MIEVERFLLMAMMFGKIHFNGFIPSTDAGLFVCPYGPIMSSFFPIL